jgi:transglutaminase-like putative cysteine protease
VIRERRGSFLLFALAALPAQASSYSVRPPPTWVQPIDAPGDARVDVTGVDVQYLLADNQTRVTGAVPSRYSRNVNRIVTEAGMASAAEIELTLNPAFEQLAIHWVRRIRGGKATDALKAAEVKVLHREERLESRLFDGSISIFIVLHDVRVGDVIDYAFTVDGQNPVFEGRFTDGLTLGYSVPVSRLRYRLIWPAARPLAIRKHGTTVEPVRSAADDVIEWRWELDDVKAITPEDALPGSFDPYPWVQLSEWTSWAEVASWAARQFEPERAAAPAVKRKADEIAAGNSDVTARYLAALRFVQDEVRYFAFLLGPNSHRPHTPEWVLERRFGDCKDKVRLLVALLREMGIHAEPALVNSRLGPAVLEFAPSPLVFNHLILRAEIDGRGVWADATSSLERGRLSARDPPDMEWALVVTPETTELTSLPAPSAPEPFTDIEERYSAKDRSAPVQLEIVTRYRRASANGMRHSLATTTLPDLTRTWLNFYARTDPGIRTTRDATVEDDQERNVITVTERYAIPDFWDNHKRSFYAWAIDEHLAAPRISQRSMPLGISHPVDVRYAVRFDMPENIPVKTDRDALSSNGFRFESHLRGERNKLMLDYRYRSLTSRIEPADVAKHLAMQKKVRDVIGYHVTIGKTSSNDPIGLWRGGYVLFIVVSAVSILWSLRRRRKAAP